MLQINLCLLLLKKLKNSRPKRDRNVRNKSEFNSNQQDSANQAKDESSNEAFVGLSEDAATQAFSKSPRNRWSFRLNV